MSSVPPDSTSTPTKKGLSGLAIAGIGCLGLLALVAVAVVVLGIKGCSMVKGFVAEAQKNPAKAAAYVVLKANPDVEIVGENDAAGEITVKDKKTGEVLTMSFDDIKNGRFKVKNAKGEEATLDASDVAAKGIVMKGPKGEMVIGGSGPVSAPAWVPVYAGLKNSSTTVRTQENAKVSGLFTGQTDDAVGKVKEFYESKLTEAGFKNDVSTSNINGTEVDTVTGKKDEKYKVSVIINTVAGKTQVTVQYEGEK